MLDLIIAAIYLVFVIVVVDLSYRSIVIVRHAFPRFGVPSEGIAVYFLGLIPPAAGIASGVLFGSIAPSLELVSILTSALDPRAIIGGAAIAAFCSALAIGICLGMRVVQTRVAPFEEMPQRTGAFLMVAGDLLIWASFEEIVFRGQLLTSLANVMPGSLAVLVSAVLFAATHLWKRRDAPVLWAFNTFLFGLLAGQLVMTTGSLLSAIALHFIWNITQTPLMGLPANGSEYDQGMFVCEVTGPTLVTGGTWSLDAGLIATAALVSGIILTTLL